MAEPIAIKHTLHGLRVNYGLTREEVAECIGIGPNAVTRYEKGAQGMKGVVRDKFARFYGVDQGQIDFDGKHALREEFLAAQQNAWSNNLAESQNVVDFLCTQNNDRRTKHGRSQEENAGGADLCRATS